MERVPIYCVFIACLLLHGGIYLHICKNDPKIWRRIVDAPEEATVTKEDVSGLMKQYLYQILKRQDHRKLILAQRDSIKKEKEEAASKN